MTVVTAAQMERKIAEYHINLRRERTADEERYDKLPKLQVALIDEAYNAGERHVRDQLRAIVGTGAATVDAKALYRLIEGDTFGSIRKDLRGGDLEAGPRDCCFAEATPMSERLDVEQSNQQEPLFCDIAEEMRYPVAAYDAGWRMRAGDVIVNVNNLRRWAEAMERASIIIEGPAE